MAINRAQLAKELEPGLNALFGLEYAQYENQHAGSRIVHTLVQIVHSDQVPTL